MEKNYRVDPGFRALGGSSLGGLFNYEEEFHRQHKALPVSLYITGNAIHLCPATEEMTVARSIASHNTHHRS